MPLTDNVDVFTTYVVNLLKLHQTSLGLKFVFYGDQRKIPAVPVVCVVPSPKSRQYHGAPRRTQNRLEVMVLIYHALLADTQVTEQQCIQFAEAVEDILHADAQCNNLMVGSLVELMEPGYTTRAGSLYRATRLTFAGTSLSNLPQSA